MIFCYLASLLLNNYVHMQCLCILCIFWEIKHLNLNLNSKLLPHLLAANEVNWCYMILISVVGAHLLSPLWNNDIKLRVLALHCISFQWLSNALFYVIRDSELIFINFCMPRPYSHIFDYHFPDKIILVCQLTLSPVESTVKSWSNMVLFLLKCSHPVTINWGKLWDGCCEFNSLRTSDAYIRQ